MGLREIL